MSSYKRMVLLGLAVIMLVCSSLACDEDTSTDTLIEDTDDLVSDEVEAGLDVLNAANCKLGLSTCITETVTE